MSNNLAVNLEPITKRHRLELVMSYEEQFADMGDMISSGDAAIILDVSGVQSVHYILENLPDDAPQIDIEYEKFGKRTYRKYRKEQVIALRRYRDAKG